MEFRADRWSWIPPGEPTGWTLERRGVRHGAVLPREAVRLTPAAARARWDAAEPVLIRGALEVTAEARRRIARSAAMFGRLRQGADPAREIGRRLDPEPRFERAGESVDLADDREIGKVHADLRRRGRPPLTDLWAKVSRVSRDPRDDSMRIRFSFGAERLDDWRSDPERALAADELAEAVFPECRLLTAHRPVASLLRSWTGAPARFSERIVFSNAPGGGAVFHHDAEDGQLGVAYAQLAGRTAWLALSKRALAEEIAARAGRIRASAVLRRLESHDPATDRLLNRTPALTRRLVERGSLYVLRAGDVLLLPSHGPDEAAWHSVFALGRRPSLAHSHGLFRARPT
jgi:hypothetical protein